jgi:hypothetical protein
LQVTCLECDQPATGITRYCNEHQHENWHGWFAWYPVLTLTGQWAWFSIVIRKRIRVTPISVALTLPWQTTFWYRIPEEW